MRPFLYFKQIFCSLLLASQAYSYKPCPLLGQSFEPPKRIGASSTFQEALEGIRGALDNATRTGTTEYGVWSPRNNSFSIGIFDATTPGQLFSYQHSSETLTGQGVHNVTDHSIYRIGSVSKLVTVYLFLIEAGPKYWNRPATDFIPSLSQAAEDCSALQNAIDCIDWTEVTLGSLASQMAGLPRDYSTIAEILSPLNAGEDLAVSLGFPPLPDSAVPPCGMGATGCSKQAYLDGLAAERPNFAPHTTPNYSNAAYAVLAMALENITGRSMSDMLEGDLFDRLNMTNSSYRRAKSASNSAIPAGAELAFGADLGADNPAGGMFSTQADLARMGQSILSSELLKPTVTRGWMKPQTFTSSMTQAVGMPWEIVRVPDIAGQTIDLYTKAGDLLSYSSYLVLSPDFNVGVVVLVAGDDPTSTAEQLANTITAGMFSALAVAAEQQAAEKYSGVYTATSSGSNSTLTISTESGRPGLTVTGWVNNGTSADVPLSQLLGVPSGIDVRLYSSGLVQMQSPTCERVAYRAIFDDTNRVSNGGIFDSLCSSWTSVNGAGTYGNVGVDGFVFKVEEGRAISVELGAFRAELYRQ